MTGLLSCLGLTLDDVHMKTILGWNTKVSLRFCRLKTQTFGNSTVEFFWNLFPLFLFKQQTVMIDFVRIKHIKPLKCHEQTEINNKSDLTFHSWIYGSDPGYSVFTTQRKRNYFHRKTTKICFVDIWASVLQKDASSCQKHEIKSFSGCGLNEASGRCEHVETNLIWFKNHLFTSALVFLSPLRISETSKLRNQTLWLTLQFIRIICINY